jgi:hypothetical protein
MKKLLTSISILLLTVTLNAQLIIYSGFDQTGSSATCASSIVYKGTGIPGGLNNSIKSISLSQGYQAVLAIHENGIGESFCYVAAVSNVIVNLSLALQDKVSFIRVLPLKNVKKRGACTTSNTLPDSLNASWFYDWGTNDTSATNREYTLMAWGSNSVTEAKIDQYIAKPGITTLLSFNEPDGVGQANLTVANGHALNKKLLRAGYRMGSPAPTEGEWDNWLLDFMNLAKQDTVRVDYIAVHWYDWGNWLSTFNTAPPASQILNRLKSYINSVYNLYKKPIWITELNCNKNRTEQTHIDFLNIAMPYLDSDPRIERYAYFFEDNIPPNGPTGLTPIGQVYANHVSTPTYTSNIVDTRTSFPEIVSWNTSGVLGGGQSVPSLMPTSVAPNLNIVQGIERGTGTTFSAGSISNGYWGNNGWSATTATNGINLDKVLTFKIQSTNGKDVSYSSIDSFKIRIAGNGPIQYRLDYKINNDAYVIIDTVGGVPRTTGNYKIDPINLSNISALQFVPPTTVVTFRIVPFDCVQGAFSNNDGVFYIGAGPSETAADFSITGRLTDNPSLPIKLSQFTSQLMNDKVQLNWKTQVETNFSHFELERSVDQNIYTKIATVQSLGSSFGSNYAYLDNPNLNYPKYYYRLKMVDLDGTYSYSKVLLQNINSKSFFALRNNVINNNLLDIQFDKVKGNVTLKMLSTNGKLVKSINLNKPSGYQSFDISSLTTGAYLVVLQDAETVVTKKIIKQ